MATTATNRVDWQLIWAQRGFRYFFVAMFVSLFGSGMNFAGVSWYILAATHSTLKVSGQVMVMTLPGLFVPFLGGVLIDRIDRRYLGVLLDLTRGVFVLATAYIAWRGQRRDVVFHCVLGTAIGITCAAVICLGFWLLFGGWGPPAPEWFGLAGLVAGLFLALLDWAVGKVS